MAPESHFLLLKFQCQSLFLSLSAKEYDAPWLVNTKTTFRDAFGRFTSKGAEVDAAIASQIETIRASWGELKVSADSLIEESVELAKQIETTIGSESVKLRQAIIEKCVNSSAEFKKFLGQDPFPEYAQQIKQVVSTIKGEVGKVTAPVVDLINVLNEQNKKVLQLLYDPETLKNQPVALQLAAKAITGLVSVGVFSAKVFGIQCLSALIFPLLASTPIFVASPMALPALKLLFDNILLLTYIDDLAKKYYSLAKESKALPLSDKAIKFSKEIAKDTASFVIFSCLSDFGVKLIKSTLLENPQIVTAYKNIKEAIDKNTFQSAVKQYYNSAQAIANQIEGSAVDLPEEIWKIKDFPAHIANKIKQGNFRGVYPLDTKVVTHVLTNIRDKESTIVAKIGGTKEAEALVSLANANLRRVYDGTSLYIRAPIERVDNILTNAQFKSTFVTNTRSSNAYIKKRSNVEKKLFGYDPVTTEPSDRPIYGYLARKGKFNTEEGVDTDSYGTVAIKLKDSIRNQATVLGQDSFWTADTNCVPSFLKAPSVATYIQDSAKKEDILVKLGQIGRAKSPVDLMAIAANNTTDYGVKINANYLEFSVHNRLTKDEVEEIVFTKYSQETIDRIVKAITTADGKIAVEKLNQFRGEFARSVTKSVDERKIKWSELGLSSDIAYSGTAMLDAIATAIKKGIKVSGSPGGYL